MPELTGPNDGPESTETGEALLERCRDLSGAGHFAEALADLSQLLRRATEAGDLPLSAATLYLTAWCCMRLGKTDAGLDCAGEARRQWVRQGHVGETARTMALEALLLLDIGLADEGYEEAEQAISAAEMSGDTDILAFARNVKACILAVCGQPQLAQPLLQSAMDAVTRTGDRQAHAFYHLNMGFVEYKLFEAAEHAGEVEQGIAHLDKAVDLSERAMQLAHEAGEMWVLRSAIANAAELNARAGHLTRARNLMADWEEVPGDPGASANIHYLYTLADILIRQGELEEARAVCTRALDLARTNNQIDHLVNVTRRLAEIHAGLGDHEPALEMHRQFHALYVRQTGETARRRANTNAVRWQTAQWRQRANHYADEAMRDPLTGIANRRRFDQELANLASRPLALGIVDLDHFKSVNDAHTHLVGDEVLKRVSALMEKHIGRKGLVARLGGEEFGLVFPNARIETAIAHVASLRQALAATDWSDLAPNLNITISVGLAAGEGQADTGVLMTTADRRLYAAKNRGRDQVVAADDPATSSRAAG